MKILRAGAIASGIFGAGLWTPLATAQGAFESYLLRSAVAERHATLSGLKNYLAENPQALERCDTLPEGTDAAIKLEKIKDGCRISIGFEPGRIWVDLRPGEDGNMNFQCATDLPPMIVPEYCRGRVQVSPPAGDINVAQAVLLSARGEISGVRERLLDADPDGDLDREYERRLVDIMTQILAERRRGGQKGLNTWLRELLQNPEGHPGAFVIAERDSIFFSELSLALVTNAIAARQCEWLDFSLQREEEEKWYEMADPNDDQSKQFQAFLRALQAAEHRTCRLCSATVGSEQLESLLSFGSHFDDQLEDLVGRHGLRDALDNTDLAMAIKHRCLTSEQRAEVAQRLKLALSSPPELDEQRRQQLHELYLNDDLYRERSNGLRTRSNTSRNGAGAKDMDDWVDWQWRKNLQFLYDLARHTEHTLPASLSSYLDESPPPLAALITESTRWLLDPEGRSTQRLEILGRAWAAKRLDQPVFGGLDVEKIAIARGFDLLTELAPLTTYSPELTFATVEATNQLGNQQPAVKFATEIMLMLALATEGRQAEVMRLVARLRPQLQQFDLPAEMRDVTGPAMDLFELAVSGQVRPLLDRIVKPLVECSGLLDGERGICEALRLTMAEKAVESGLVDQARQLLAQRPEQGEAEILPLLRAYHLLLVARLALLEGDLATADTAYGLASALIDPESTVAKVREAREALDLLGLRLDLALGRKQQARIKLQQLASADAGQPLPAQVVIEDELAVAGWQLDPGAKALAAISNVQVTELRYLQLASRGGDEALVRALLNMRASRRDRRLAVAVANPSAGNQLAWSESAWFKGIEERLASPGQAADAEPWHPDAKTVQSKLPASAVVLDFAVYARTEFPSQRPGVRHLLVSILTKEGAPQLVDLGAFDRIEAAVLELRTAIQQQDEATTDRVAAGLAGSLFTPLRTLLKDASVVVVVPDSTLHLLPFDVLRKPAGWPATRGLQVAASLYQALAKAPTEAATPAGMDVQIVAAPDYGEPQPDAAAALSFAPLPGAAEEGKVLMQLWGEEQAQLWSGSAASETQLRALHAPRILHLATHGYARGAQAVAVDASGTRGLGVVAAPAQVPVLSDKAFGGFGAVGNRVLSRLLGSYDDPLLRVGIALSGANDPDGEAASNGILDGREVTALDLQGTELVVLSACETAVGESLDGSAVGSLQRAFHRAGAQWVLSTLWPIDDDATAVLMQAFHQELRAGSDPQAALVRAKQALQAEPKWQQPYFWAAFQLSGPLRASVR